MLWKEFSVCLTTLNFKREKTTGGGVYIRTYISTNRPNVARTYKWKTMDLTLVLVGYGDGFLGHHRHFPVDSMVITGPFLTVFAVLPVFQLDG